MDGSVHDDVFHTWKAAFLLRFQCFEQALPWTCPRPRVVSHGDDRSSSPVANVSASSSTGTAIFHRKGTPSRGALRASLRGEPRSDAVVPTTSHRPCGFPSVVPPGGPLLPPSRIRNRFAVVDRIRPRGGHGSDVGRREVDVPSKAASSTTRGGLRRLLRFRYVET